MTNELVEKIEWTLEDASMFSCLISLTFVADEIISDLISTAVLMDEATFMLTFVAVFFCRSRRDVNDESIFEQFLDERVLAEVEKSSVPFNADLFLREDLNTTMPPSKVADTN